MSQRHKSPDTITEADFVDTYGDEPVTMGEHTIPLRAAVAMEAAFCPNDSQERRDPAERLAYLARKVGRGTLQPEHQHLLPSPTPNDY